MYDPSSYVSILKNHPVEWFDNAMSYGVFNWGLNPVGVRGSVIFCGWGSAEGSMAWTESDRTPQIQG